MDPGTSILKRVTLDEAAGADETFTSSWARRRPTPHVLQRNATDDALYLEYLTARDQPGHFWAGLISKNNVRKNVGDGADY